MTQFYRYRNAIGAASDWAVDLGDAAVRFGALDGLTELAEHLQVGTSSIVLDDPDANLGHDGDGILGLQRFEIDETAMAAGNRRLWSGIITQTTYRRGGSDRPSLRLGARRQIELSVVDLNTIPTLHVIDPHDPDAKRPAETVDDRLAWILGSTYLSGLVADNGLVESSTVLMDAVPEGYGGQTAANVIGDCEIAAGFGWNAWVYYDEATDQPSLGFLNANTSTTYTSTLRLSNVLEDLDATTLAPGYEAELSKDPSSLISGVHVAWGGGDVFRERTATKDIYGPREQTAPNSNIKSATTAGRIGEDYLFQHSTDADNIETTVELAADQVNLIRAGHRLQVKYSHLPGYQDWTWTRVIRRSVTALTADLYSLSLDLSPQEAAAPAAAVASIVQSVFVNPGAPGTDATFPNNVTIGNLLVSLIGDRGSPNPSGPSTGPSGHFWGSGAWTKLPNVTIRTGATLTDGVAIWEKIADAVDRIGHIGNSEARSGTYEIAGGDITSATTAYVTSGTPSTTMTIADMGTPVAGSVALMIAMYFDQKNNSDPFFPRMDAASPWVQDYWGPAYFGGVIQWNAPLTGHFHAICDGSTPLVAEVTRASLHGPGNWCGAVIVIPPL